MAIVARGPERTVDIADEDEHVEAVDGVPATDGPPPATGTDPADAVLAELSTALAGADDLPLDERLELLRRAEGEISRSLEGLDGL